MTALELDRLRQEFPEGIPPWMLEREYTAEQVRELMRLRREAFPRTARPAK
jgi:hypothetical protein